ncbi:hypothetical protein MHY87_13110 [Microvirga sp. ACRRW]|uniref:hypothetical protein n=1 Tax=Microvirga sp. ACRRW TaxID=2918205 RepID=UPI001EF6FA09|nr:hypothetical protein [Microvirga sp. ACRRW]MCG7393845.1 hypothetical protein [Microvirga sp. ACRRW]
MKTAKFAFLIILGFSAGIAVPAAFAAEVWEGRWATGPDALENCGADTLDTDNGIVDLTSKGYESYASVCTFKRLQRTQSGWQAAASCAEEGEESSYNTTAKISMPNSDRLKLVVGQTEVELVRCPQTTRR